MSKNFKNKGYYDIFKISYDAYDKDKDAWEVLRSRFYKKIYNRSLYKKAGNDNINPNKRPNIWQRLFAISLQKKQKIFLTPPSSNKR